MANENLIDTVITDAPEGQVVNLTKLLADLDIQMVANIKSANALNNATANSKSFKDLGTNASKTALEIEKVNQAQAKTVIANNQVAISNNRLEASNAKSAASATKASGEYAKLLKAYNEATLAARNAGVQFGATSPQFLKASESVKALRTQLDSVDQPLGNYQRNVGNYTNSIISGFSRVYSVIRQAAFILPGLGISGIFLLAYEGIKKLVEEMGIFSTVATEMEQRQKGLADAFNSTDYTKSVEDIEKLSVNLDLAKKGFIDSDSAINEYNSTIGKTFGYVDNLNDAQKGFIDNSADYIKAIYLESAAQIVLADSAKFAAEQAVKNQKIRQDIEDFYIEKANVRKGNAEDFGGDKRGLLNSIDKSIQSDFEAIKKNNQKVKEEYNNSLKAVENFYTDRAKIMKDHGVKSGGNSEGDAIAQLRNEIANNDLERQKLIAQQIISNEKLSYSARIKATNDFYNASKQIADNNKKLETDGIKLSDSQKLKIEGDYSNEVLKLQQSRDNELKSLRDKAYEQDQQILKNNIQKQKDLLKSIIEDPKQSMDAKLGAIQLYNDRSKDLIDANYKEQKRQSGDNDKSITLAKQEKQKADLQLDNEIAKQRIDVQKKAEAELKRLFEEGLKNANAALQNEIIDLKDAQDTKLLQIDKFRSDSLKKQADLYRDGKTSAAEYNQAVYDIEAKTAKDRVDAQIDTIQKIIDKEKENLQFGIGSARELQKNQDTLTKLRIDASDLATKVEIDNIKKLEDAKKNLHTLEKQLTSESIDLVKTLVDAGYERQIEALKKQSDQINENAANEKDVVNNSIASSKTKARETAVIDAQTAQAQKQLQAEQAKIKHKEAEFDKAISIAKVLQATGTAEVEALSYLSNPFTAPLYPAIAALIAGIGAAQLGLILATPIPQFAKGGTTPGGPVIWGEAGMERATLPSGEVRFSKGAELANFPRGTVITPHMQLMQQLKPAEVRFVGGEQIPWKELIKAVKDNKVNKRSRVNVNVDLGYESYKRSYLKR